MEPYLRMPNTNYYVYRVMNIISLLSDILTRTHLRARTHPAIIFFCPFLSPLFKSRAIKIITIEWMYVPSDARTHIPSYKWNKCLCGAATAVIVIAAKFVSYILMQYAWPWEWSLCIIHICCRYSGHQFQQASKGLNAARLVYLLP